MVYALLASGGVEAATRIVPDQFSQIQNAVVASSAAGDTVLVRPGTYFENIDYLSKDVVIRSVSGPEVTIIDGSQPSNPDRASVVILQGVGNGARLEGFALRGGTGSIGMAIGPPGTKAGGGVCISDNRNLGPLIQNNWIIGNHAAEGGGVLIAGACRVRSNRIVGNTAGPSSNFFSGNGGGIFLSEFGSPVSLERRIVSDNEISGNHATTLGGGCYLLGFNTEHLWSFSGNIVACNDAPAGAGFIGLGNVLSNIVERNTFFANVGSAGMVAGVQLTVPPGQSLIFRKNLVAYNFTGGVECAVYAGYETPEFNCNDFEGNNPEFMNSDCGAVIGLNGNLSVDPMFGQVSGCPPAPGDLCLSAESPLLPDNSPPGCGLIGARGLCGPVGIADETPAPGAERSRVSAQPNPFATRTTLVIDLVAPAAVDLRITNALGRVVTEQSLGTMHAGRHRWTWDGRDAAGRRAPVGVYYAEVQADGQAIVTRLMILR